MGLASGKGSGLRVVPSACWYLRQCFWLWSLGHLKKEVGAFSLLITLSKISHTKTILSCSQWANFLRLAKTYLDASWAIIHGMGQAVRDDGLLLSWLFFGAAGRIAFHLRSSQHLGRAFKMIRSMKTKYLRPYMASETINSWHEASFWPHYNCPCFKRGVPT